MNGYAQNEKFSFKTIIQIMTFTLILIMLLLLFTRLSDKVISLNNNTEINTTEKENYPEK